MRVMFPMYDTPIHFLALEESGIRSIDDLAGKRVGVGPQGGTSGTYIPKFFDTLGIKATLSNGDWSTLAEQMEQHQIDALAVASGVPFPAFAQIEARSKVTYVPLTASQITALDLAMPELEPSVIQPGSYPSLMGAYRTVGLYNLAVAHESLPNDLVYAIIRAVFSRHDELMEAHPAAASTIPENFTRNTFLPFHGGAVRYYQEIGVSGVAISD
jgi:TRAP transporter TAXI family solute receptor